MNFSVRGRVNQHRRKPDMKYPALNRSIGTANHRGINGIAKAERWILYCAVFFAPYVTLRASELFFTLSDLLYCVCFFLLLIVRRTPRVPLGGATTLWLGAFLMLMVGLMIGSIVQGDTVRGVIVIVQYFFSYVILLFVLVRDDKEEAHRLAMVFLASILVIDIHGIVTFYSVGYVPDSRVVSGGRRLGTLLGQPNGAAAINAFVVSMVLYLWLCGRVKTWLAIVVLGVAFTTVILTSSNSGLIMLGCCLAAFFGCAMNYRLLWRFVLIGVFGVMAYFAGGSELLPETFHRRVLGALASGDLEQAGTYLDRLRLIYEAVDLIGKKEILLVGLGADQFRVLSEQGAPVHNLYLLLWVEGGLLALAGWLLFIFIGVRLALAVRRSGGSTYLSAMMMSTLAVFATFAAVTAHLYARTWLTPVLIGLGLVMVRLQEYQSLSADHRIGVRTLSKTRNV